MQSPSKISKAAQREATLKKLIEVARQEFGAQGYAAASTEQIVQMAGVTRGALYHHFVDKQALFLAVFADVQREIANRIVAAASRASEPWLELLAGCRTFLEACNDPQLRQIVIVDAPAVLGWEMWRKVDAEHGSVTLVYSLKRLTMLGVIKPLPTMALAHLLNGAMNEAVMWIAQAENPQQALEEAYETLVILLGALRHDANVV